MKSTLFSFNDRRSFSVSIVREIGLEFPAFGQHQGEPLLDGEAGKICQLKLQFLLLVCFLESTFGIEVADEEMLPENLDSIRAVTAYVSRKLERKRAQQLAAA